MVLFMALSVLRKLSVGLVKWKTVWKYGSCLGDLLDHKFLVKKEK